MKILYLGAVDGTSRHRANALTRVGHEVKIVDPDRYVPQGKLISKVHWETGGILAERKVAEAVLREVCGLTFDLVWVDSGRYVGPILVRDLQKRFGPVLNYNIDDPFGRRDRFSWSLYRRTVSVYDLVAVVRDVNIEEAKSLGARKVIRVYRSADEVAHAPMQLTDEDRREWGTEVLFIGTGFPERGAFMSTLIDRGVPLSIFGNGWDKLKHWPRIKAFWKRKGTTNDADYIKAVQSSRVCLGLLSKENRDLHTTRSLEIPSIGGLFCAERTVEHRLLYDEGTEALFWNSADECASRCLDLLSNEPARAQIAQDGHKRFLKNGNLNERVVRDLLAELN